jgi:two-component system chemotaxis response regulator CheB
MAIRVLIIDDSATARSVLTNALEKDKEIEVVGTAPDAYIGRDKIINLKPDVICLDVEMPRMDGITFLKKIMEYTPTPVLMVSSLTKKGAQVTFDALEAGAVDVVEKPHQNIYSGIDEIEKELIKKVKVVASSNISKKIAKQKTTKTVSTLTTNSLATTTNKVIVIGSSTGGTVALAEFVKQIPRNLPGIVIVQHMPGGFTKSFAERLNSLSKADISEAKDGEIIGRGKVLVAPGDYHVVIKREGGQYKVKIGTGDKVSGHCPSVDVLFNSASKEVGSNAVGIIMTGMGSDGAKGMLRMRKAGAKTIGQTEESCVVYGMPKAAFELGSVEEQVSLEDIPNKLVQILNKMK